MAPDLTTLARPARPTGVPRHRFAAWPVAAVAAGVVALLLPYSGRYGYNVDELYFRMLGQRGWSWGYVDQPPLVPYLSKLSIDVFGDSVAGMRVPAVLCAAAIVVLGTLITVELGGNRRAQLLAALGLGTSSLVLAVGHVLVTSTLDMLAWTAATLFAIRALYRADGRWWLAAGLACGVGMYSKYIVVLLPATLLTSLLLVGPRSALRDRWLLLGIALGLAVGSPNLVYQATHDFPQLQMAGVLGSTDGQLNRFIFVPSLPLILGLALTPIWVAGLVTLLRAPRLRSLRAVAVAAGLGSLLLIVGGGRPDYVGGFLITLFAAGCVPTARWLIRRRWRLPVTAVALAASAALQVLVALPVLPERTLAEAPLNDISLQSVGWPELVDQVAAAYHDLPADERRRAVLLAANFGEAGAIDRYGDRHGLPAVYSGHNELYHWGPPPDTADLAVAVGMTAEQLQTAFASCAVVGRVDNGIGVQNAEQGKEISVCRDRRAPWAALWPSYRYLSG